MKKQLSVEIQGHNKRWSFTFIGDPAHLPDWRADGLCVEVIENRVPTWIASLGKRAVWLWCRAQDLVNFKF